MPWPAGSAGQPETGARSGGAMGGGLARCGRWLLPLWRLPAARRRPISKGPIIGRTAAFWTSRFCVAPKGRFRPARVPPRQGARHDLPL